MKAFREEIISRKQQLYLDNEREVSIRWVYENAVIIYIYIFFLTNDFQIKRPYFHVKPLERDQLRNWYSYLDFEIRSDKKTRILFLFERCMIACANYEEMWIKVSFYQFFVNNSVCKLLGTT